MIATEYKYSLDTTSRKFHCPNCGKKRFVRYVDNETGQYLPADIGRCDREQKCAYHKTPKQGGYSIAKALYTHPRDEKPKKFDTLPFSYVEKSKGNYKNNVFIQWLATLPGWDHKRAENVARLYHVGTYRNGWPIFWQVDDKGRCRSGKMMKYDPETGKRVRSGYNYNTVQAKMKKSGHLDDFNLVECCFGLHLVDGSKPVAIVEAEKTAIIASQYLPQFTWIAFGGKGKFNGNKPDKLVPLAGQNVTLFPDMGAYQEWQKEARKLAYLVKMKVSNLLERKAPDEHQGYDLADYLIQFHINEFIGKAYPSPNKDRSSNGKCESFKFRNLRNLNNYPTDWDEVTISDNDPEWDEYTRFAARECDDALDRARMLDPMIGKIEQTFDCEVI